MRMARAARPQRRCTSCWGCEWGQGRATTLSLSVNPGAWPRGWSTQTDTSGTSSPVNPGARPRGWSTPALLPGLLHPLPLELRHLERPRGARQEAPRLERTCPAAADGVVPRAQLDPDRVPQPLGELTRAAAVHARRHHRELGGPDATDRIGAAPARLEQPRDTAQRLDALAPSVLAVAVGSDRYAGNRRIVPPGLQDQLAGAARQTVRGVQTGHVVHQVPTRHTVSLDFDEHVAVQLVEQPGDVQRLPHQLPHARP